MDRIGDVFYANQPTKLIEELAKDSIKENRYVVIAGTMSSGKTVTKKVLFHEINQEGYGTVALGKSKDNEIIVISLIHTTDPNHHPTVIVSDGH